MKATDYDLAVRTMPQGDGHALYVAGGCSYPPVECVAPSGLAMTAEHTVTPTPGARTLHHLRLDADGRCYAETVWWS